MVYWSQETIIQNLYKPGVQNVKSYYFICAFHFRRDIHLWTRKSSTERKIQRGNVLRIFLQHPTKGYIEKGFERVSIPQNLFHLRLCYRFELRHAIPPGSRSSRADLQRQNRRVCEGGILEMEKRL